MKNETRISKRALAKQALRIKSSLEPKIAPENLTW
jgi:hypothetical protein